jgi:23S rRNA pseudouridine1911/1915/1917 synthase
MSKIDINDKNLNTHQFVVEDLKTRIDRYLANQLPGVSRSQIQKDIEAGLVLVNGEKVLESKFVVRKDDIVKYQISNIKYQKEDLRPSNIPLKVLYDNHGLLIIDKPAGLTVHPGAGFKGETLASALLYNFKDIKLVGEEGRPGIVHRLDKDTSGVILVAKTQDMYEYLKDAFFERKVKKEYIALVQGRVEKPAGKIDLPIGKSKSDFRKMEAYPVRSQSPKATANVQAHWTSKGIEPKEALTEYKVLEYLDLSDTLSAPLRGHLPQRGRKIMSGSSVDTATLLLVKLHTGRTHQIRAHMKAIGHPLMGDSLYGGKISRIDGLNRQFLHAKKIEVRLPDGTWIEAESELPNALKEILINLKSKQVNNL